MSFADPFIKRPVLTSVCSLAIFIAGLVALRGLPVEFVPDVAPPQIQINATYPGGNASIVETSVTDRLEDLLSDTPGVDYLKSTSTGGQSSIYMYLSSDASADTAMLDAQNRLQRGIQTLPSITQQQGISITQSTDAALSSYIITSDQGQYDTTYLASLVDSSLKKQVQLINGVGRVTVSPPDSRFQVFLDPDLLKAYDLTSSEVAQRIRSQNSPSSAGSVGAASLHDEASYTYPVLVKDGGYIQTVEQLENLAVRTAPSGALIRLKDIGTVSYLSNPAVSLKSLDGFDAIYISINQKSGTNAVQVASEVERVVADFKRNAPSGIRVVQFDDKKLFILDSIDNVFNALGLAVVLVLITLILFLKKWRTILIPALAIPVAIAGAFLFLGLFGFTLNFLTLSGLVLATGLVVDDAILVVESVSKKIQAGLPPRQAAFATMNELSVAVVSTSLVLITLFVPLVVVVSSVGKIYQQFAVTIISAIAISTFNALTFSPMMAGVVLGSGSCKPASRWITGLGGLLVGILFGLFTRASFGDWIVPVGISIFTLSGFYLSQIFSVFESAYAVLEAKFEIFARYLIKRYRLVTACLLPAVMLTIVLWNSIPSDLIPQEDQNVLFGGARLAPGASLTETAKVAAQASALLKQEQQSDDAAIKDAVVVAGFPNRESMFVLASLKPLADRPDKAQSAERQQRYLGAKLFSLPVAFPPGFFQPPMINVASDSQIKMLLVDKSNRAYSFEELKEISQRFKVLAQKDPSIARIDMNFDPDAPAYELTLDRARLSSLGVDFNQATKALSDLAGGSLVSQTSVSGGLRDIQIISDLRGRREIDDLLNYSVRARDGGMIQVRQFADAELVSAPPVIHHFNFTRSVPFSIQQAPGFSQGQVIDRLGELFAETGFKDLDLEFDGQARTQVDSNGQVLALFLMAGLAVFLILSATYESYFTSTTILITVPLAIFGGLFFVKIMSLNLNIFSQVGLLMLIGLAAKNTILVVEVADQGMAQGLAAAPAALLAAQSRLRPILMTSIASLAGFIPLVVARGAGANALQSIGAVVFGGLLVGTILSLGVVPPVYVAIKSLEARLFGSRLSVDPTS